MRADWIKLMIAAARLPLRSDPANNQFERPRPDLVLDLVVVDGQRGLGAGAHIHGLGGEPDGVDADHLASSRTKRAHPSGSEVGHLTVIDSSPTGISMIASASVGRLGAAFNGTNAGSAAAD